MTILHVSDLHFDKRWFHWLSVFAPRHDVLVIAGDLLDHAHPAAPAKQADWIGGWIRGHHKPLCICSGNHDLLWDDRESRWAPATWLRALAGPAVHVDGERLELRGLTLAVHGARSAETPDADIWVMHVPPTGLAVSRVAAERDHGDPDSTVWRAERPPRLVLSGHVHNPACWYDRARGVAFMNPGRNPAARFPNHVLIDLVQNSAIYVSDGPGSPRCRVWQLPASPTTACVS